MKVKVSEWRSYNSDEQLNILETIAYSQWKAKKEAYNKN